MHVEDKSIAMRARHAIAKSSLDISELTLSGRRGCIELSGRVKRPRNHTGGLNVKKEFEVLVELVRHSPGVREVISERVLLIE